MDCRSVLHALLLVGCSIGSVATAASSREQPTMPAGKPDLVLRGRDCQPTLALSDAPELFSLSFYRRGEVVFNGRAGVRALGEHRELYRPETLQPVLRGAEALWHRSGFETAGYARLCLEVDMSGLNGWPARIAHVDEGSPALAFMGEVAETVQPLRAWVCPQGRGLDLRNLCSRWYHEVFRSDWATCETEYRLEVYSDGTVHEQWTEWQSGAVKNASSKDTYFSVPTSGIRRVLHAVPEFAFDGPAIIEDCIPAPCPPSREDFQIASTTGLQSFWETVHRYLPIEERRRPAPMPDGSRLPVCPAQQRAETIAFPYELAAKHGATRPD
jgi:hypothetical protein